jgi:hypothetical protein
VSRLEINMESQPTRPLTRHRAVSSILVGQGALASDPVPSSAPGLGASGIPCPASDDMGPADRGQWARDGLDVSMARVALRSTARHLHLAARSPQGMVSAPAEAGEARVEPDLTSRLIRPVPRTR